MPRCHMGERSGQSGRGGWGVTLSASDEVYPPLTGTCAPHPAGEDRTVLHWDLLL